MATYTIEPHAASLLKQYAVAVATLTGYTNTAVPGGFEVHVTSAAAIVVNPALPSDSTAVTITPAAEQLPYKVPFRCRAIDATSVATSIVAF